MKTLLLFLIAALFYCCESADNLNANGTPRRELYNVTSNFGDIEVVEIDSCEYVIWHNGYGSDMEHHEGCNNPKHK